MAKGKTIRDFYKLSRTVNFLKVEYEVDTCSILRSLLVRWGVLPHKTEIRVKFYDLGIQ